MKKSNVIVCYVKLALIQIYALIVIPNITWISHKLLLFAKIVTKLRIAGYVLLKVYVIVAKLDILNITIPASNALKIVLNVIVKQNVPSVVLTILFIMINVIRKLHNV